MALLEVREANKSFGGIQAVVDCTLDVEEGSIMGLLGPNGAGKTTLFNLITGRLPLDSGEVYFRGEKMQPYSPPHLVFEKGIYRSFQIARSLSELTVLENVLIARPGQTGENPINALINYGQVREEESEATEKGKEILNFLGLDEYADEYVVNLSGADRKLVEVGRMMVVNPKLALLDEPSAGVVPSKKETIIDRLKDLNEDRDITFLVVEHDMKFLFSLCEEVIALVDGTPIARGEPEEIRNNEKVVDAYFG